jgi:hypothetical protein
MIETYQDLRDWFLFNATINETMLHNEICARIYNETLVDPSFLNIRMFYVFSGMERFHNVKIKWEAIANDLKRIS